MYTDEWKYVPRFAISMLSPLVSTSAVFGFSAEVILEIITHFGDPRRDFLLENRMDHPALLVFPRLDSELAERLTVIRRLTMTCWRLRNMLFPLLWEYTEGRYFSPLRPSNKRYGALSHGLWAQCTYLLLNPTVGAYVRCVKASPCSRVPNSRGLPLHRTISVDLYFIEAPRDLMTKFIDCLIQLPNLRTLEVFSTDDADSLAKGLKRKSARFPGIRELGISDKTAQFLGSCPNVETIMILRRFTSQGATILSSYGGELKKLKRVVGISEEDVPLGELKKMVSLETEDVS